MKIKLHWNKYIERWVLKCSFGHNLYELPDCMAFNMLFKDIDKEKENIYELTAGKIDE